MGALGVEGWPRARKAGYKGALFLEGWLGEVPTPPRAWGG